MRLGLLDEVMELHEQGKHADASQILQNGFDRDDTYARLKRDALLHELNGADETRIRSGQPVEKKILLPSGRVLSGTISLVGK
ncbi:MAG TPA: hypothetical protein VJ884_07775 [Salinibacter sp.]|nr:hypothetical protein [Salinibacter sp.]